MIEKILGQPDDPAPIYLSDKASLPLEIGGESAPQSWNGFVAPTKSTYIFAEFIIRTGLTSKNFAALIGDNKWGNDGDTPNNLEIKEEHVSYSFPPLSFYNENHDFSKAYNTVQTSGDNFRQLAIDSHEAGAAKEALQSYADIAGIKFVDNGAGDAAIRFAKTSALALGIDVLGEAYPPGPLNDQKGTNDGDVWIWRGYLGKNEQSGSPEAWKPGSQGYYLILHETGHALGLKHPHEGVNLNSGIDSVVNTIMSIKPFTEGSKEYSLQFYPTTPMPYDIAALQFIYGVNWAHNAPDPDKNDDGNTTYKFVPGQQFYETIWDAGGNDTIDFSAATADTYISLLNGNLIKRDAAGNTEYEKDAEGHDVLDQNGKPIPLSKTSEVFGTGDTHKLLIAFKPDTAPPGDKPDANAFIENAIGGSGNDFLEGNSTDNKLVGYGGPKPAIVNGGFETGTNPPPSVFYDFWGSRPLLKDNTDLDGWTVGYNGVDWTGGLWRAAGGTKSIDLSGTTQTGTDKSGSISQEIQGLVLGKSYTVGFQLSGNFQGGDILKEGTLSIDGQKYAFDFARPANWSERNMGWVDEAFTFTFKGGSNVLKFESDDPSFYGPVIDNVRIYETDDSAESGGADTLVGGGGNDTLVGSARLDRLYGSYRHPDPRDDPRDADDGDGIDIFKIVADEIPPYVKVEDKPINNTILYGFGHRMGGRDHYGNADKIDLTEFGDGVWKLIHSGDPLKPGTIKVANHDINRWKVDGEAVSQLFGKDKDGDYFQLFIDDGKANGWDYTVDDFIVVS